MGQQAQPSRFPEAAACAVSPHRPLQLPAHGHPDPSLAPLTGLGKGDQGLADIDLAALEHALKVVLAAQAKSALHRPIASAGVGPARNSSGGYGVSRWRPFCRRLRSTRLPAGDLIFLRKPCTRPR
jgi:hypothetical protein